MSPEERIVSGGAVLALDTNALTGFQRLAELCDHVNLLRESTEPIDIRLCVPAVVHMEVLFDLRQRHGPGFDADFVLSNLFEKGLTIAPFGEAHAAQAAGRLAESFPGTREWQAAKRKRCIECLGLGQQEARITGSGKRCGATVDWVIAAHAMNEGWILVTNDTGPEFAGLALKITLERLEQLLTELVGRRGRAPDDAGV